MQFQFIDLAQLERRSGITLNATLTSTGPKVAAKARCEQLKAYYFIIYLYHSLYLSLPLDALGYDISIPKLI